MKRTILAVSAIIVVIAVSVILGGAAVSASDTSSTAVIIFDDAAQQAKLIIPTPACPASQPDCQWKFFLNEPKLSVDVATVYGTSGTLTIDYPKDFCGVIQADAYVGPPWVAERGFQHTIEDCTSPTTTMDAPVTTTTSDAPSASSTSTTTTTGPVFGSVAGTSAPHRPRPLMHRRSPPHPRWSPAPRAVLQPVPRRLSCLSPGPASRPSCWSA